MKKKGGRKRDSQYIRQSAQRFKKKLGELLRWTAEVHGRKKGKRGSTTETERKREGEKEREWRSIAFQEQAEQRGLCVECWESGLEPGLRECSAVCTNCIPALRLQDSSHLDFSKKHT